MTPTGARAPTHCHLWTNADATVWRGHNPIRLQVLIRHSELRWRHFPDLNGKLGALVCYSSRPLPSAAPISLPFPIKLI